MIVSPKFWRRRRDGCPRRSPALLPAMLMSAVVWTAAAQPASEPIQLKVLGGLAGVSQYSRHEAPFWLERIPLLTQGRVRAEIAPFDRSGIRGNDIMPLLRLGVVPFGTVILNIAGADEPELNGPDLATLNPDIHDLRRNVEAFRPVFTRILRERHNADVLAVYTYPGQVLFCTRPFTGLADIRNRRVRASSVSQADAVEALGAIPVIIPFAEIVRAIRRNEVECAITGALSGNATGLHEVTSHVHAMAFSWGISVFVAHRPSWNALPEELRGVIARGLRELEAEIWTAAEAETLEGLACNSGQAGCTAGRRGSMHVVPATAADEAVRRNLLRGIVLPRWIDRCGEECADAWNESVAASVGFRAERAPR